MVTCWLISVITSTRNICAIIGNTTGLILKNRKGGLIAHLLEIRGLISIVGKDRLGVIVSLISRHHCSLSLWQDKGCGSSYPPTHILFLVPNADPEQHQPAEQLHT